MLRNGKVLAFRNLQLAGKTMLQNCWNTIVGDVEEELGGGGDMFAECKYAHTQTHCQHIKVLLQTSRNTHFSYDDHRGINRSSHFKL